MAADPAEQTRFRLLPLKSNDSAVLASSDDSVMDCWNDCRYDLADATVWYLNED